MASVYARWSPLAPLISVMRLEVTEQVLSHRTQFASGAHMTTPTTVILLLFSVSFIFPATVSLNCRGADSSMWPFAGLCRVVTCKFSS